MSSQSPPSQDASPSSNGSFDPAPAKKRRTPGSCDHCRKRKAKCDSANMPGNKCSRCLQMNLDCSHDGLIKNLGSAKSYVEGMETRIEKYEKIIRALLPDCDLDNELDVIYNRLVLDPCDSKLNRNDDDSEEARLSGRLNFLKLNPSQTRFWGRSSNFMFVETALRAKARNDQQAQKHIMNTHKRNEFWNPRPWQIKQPPEEAQYSFPDVELIFQLADLYFNRVNSFLPLLHRPTFEEAVADGLHYRDRGFGGVVLIVAAIGARYSDDPRVLLENVDDFHSAGWKWVAQVSMPPTSLKQQATLFELQSYALYVMYGETFMWPDAWTVLGVAIRRALEVGAHRRRSTKMEPEVELWKRAFWILVWQERNLSTFFGRPCCIQEEDFDMDHPIECDDEYWEADFKQPEGIPSKISMFVALIKLAAIQAHVLRTVYKTKKHQFSPHITSQQQFIAGLDSAMNKWMEDDLPEHLRIHQSSDLKKDNLFFQQSAFLYANFYGLQLYIHKPFIPVSDTSSVYPSLAISTNAARALIRTVVTPGGYQVASLPMVQCKTWIAAITLLMHIWGGMRSGLAPNFQKDMEDVSKCRRLLSDFENRYHMSGKLGDILAGLAVAGDVSLPELPAPGTNATDLKRPREEPQTEAFLSGDNISPTVRDAMAADLHWFTGSNTDSPTFDFSFPTQSDELSRMPLFNSDMEAMLASMPSANAGSQLTTFGSIDNILPPHLQPIQFSENSFANTPLGKPGDPKGAVDIGLAWPTGPASNTGTQPANYKAINQEVLGIWNTTPAGWGMHDWDLFVDKNNEQSRQLNLT